MRKKLELYFLEKFKHTPLLVQYKARTLMYFTLAIIIPIALLLVLENILTVRAVFSLLNIVLTSIVLCLGISLFMLKKGRYAAAADVFVIACVCAVGVLNIFGTAKFRAGLVTSNYQVLIMVVFASVFCSRLTTGLVSGIAFGSVAASVLRSSMLERPEAIMVLVNFTFELIIIFVLVYLLSGIVTRTVERLSEEAENKQHYERLSELLKAICSIAQDVDTAASRMLDTSRTFAVNAQNQSASTEEITATMEEISAGGDRVAENSSEQTQRTAGLIEKLKNLSGVIETMKVKIGEASSLTASISGRARDGMQSLGKMNESMKNIFEGSGKMTEIVSIINDISDRINLLSLNAAIEAARAGNAGRGFAVVADEISKLADQTSSSVKEIDMLIRSSNNEIASGMENVKSNGDIISGIIEGVGSMSGMITQIADAMNLQIAENEKVNSEARVVLDRSEEIKASAEEQKTASYEVVKSVSGINELTQANAAGAEEMIQTVEAVAKMSIKLKAQAEGFR